MINICCVPIHSVSTPKYVSDQIYFNGLLCNTVVTNTVNYTIHTCTCIADIKCSTHMSLKVKISPSLNQELDYLLMPFLTSTVQCCGATLYENERLRDTDYMHYSYTVWSISNINIHMYAKS